MPTFPSPPLKFRTAGFPQYGFKAGFSDGAFPRFAQVKPAPGMPIALRGLRPPFVRFVVLQLYPLSVGELDSMTHRRSSGSCRSTPGVLAPVRVVLSRSIIT
jgi:hypothetical protein